jgi:acyl-CoA synthetase (NDP forming)
MQNPARHITDTEVYGWLESAGIRVPRYGVVRAGKDIGALPFAAGERVVVKGMARDLWHKSDVGAVRFAEFDPRRIRQIARELETRLSAAYDFVETLVCEQVDILRVPGYPTEALCSVKNDETCGPVVNLGVGGTFTENWAESVGDSVLSWPTAVYSPEEALAEVSGHLLGRAWLGTLRQQEPLTDEERIGELLRALWSLAAKIVREDIYLVEINPLALRAGGQFVALDAAGARSIPRPVPLPGTDIEPRTLLCPESIAIAGVSEKEGSMGRAILENVLRSSIPVNSVCVIKPGRPEILGVPCIPDLASLKKDPVDLLVLSLPARASLEMIDDIVELGGGARVVAVVAGGIGDGADHDDRGEELKELLRARRQRGEWTPAVVGPNSLGLLSAERRLNTLFIPPDKLSARLDANARLALISQSGAFLITRLSRQSHLAVKYGYCIGNQLDLTVSDFLAAMGADENVTALGVYAEGFPDGDAERCARAIEDLAERGKKVILYTGGRDLQGRMAAAGHTGAVAGDYAVQTRLFRKAGARVADTFSDFTAALEWWSGCEWAVPAAPVAVISNAGYESVGSADALRAGHRLSEGERNALAAVLDEHGLGGLCTPVLPLDITPMANEAAWIDCLTCLAGDTGAGTIIAGIVPLTPRLDTADAEAVNRFARSVARISWASKKLIAMVIDGGDDYHDYRNAFRGAGLVVFDSMDRALSGLGGVEPGR